MRARPSAHRCAKLATAERPRQSAALISAVVYIAAAPLELFFVSGPRASSLHVRADNVADGACRIHWSA